MDRRDWAALHCVALHCVVIMIPHPQYTIHIANPLVWSFRAISEEIQVLIRAMNYRRNKKPCCLRAPVPKTPQPPTRKVLPHSFHPSIHPTLTQLNSNSNSNSKMPIHRPRHVQLLEIPLLLRSQLLAPARQRLVDAGHAAEADDGTCPTSTGNSWSLA